MSEPASATTAPARREGLTFATFDAVIADIHRLRDRGYQKVGNWTLEQTAWHLDITTRARIRPGPFPPDTDEQKGRSEMLQTALRTNQLPPGIQAPPELTPPTDADASFIGKAIEALERAKTHTGFAPHRLFGQLSDEDSRAQILVHCAHHLRNLVPNDSGPARPGLRFDSVEAIIADVESLQRGCRKTGEWTLQEAAWHLALPLKFCLHPIADDARSTPEQAHLKSTRLDPMFAAGAMPPKVPVAPKTDPKTDGKGQIREDEVAKFLEGLAELQSTPLKRVAFGPFGIVTIEEFRTFMRFHAANHLQYFVPTH